MSTKPKGTFELLGYLVTSIAGEFQKITETHNRQLTRVHLELFDILDETEIHLKASLQRIGDFQQENKVGMRVYIIHQVGLHLNELINDCAHFCNWVIAHKKFLHTQDILTSELSDIWDVLSNHDDGFSMGESAKQRLLMA